LQPCDTELRQTVIAQARGGALPGHANDSMGSNGAKDRPLERPISQIMQYRNGTP